MLAISFLVVMVSSLTVQQKPSAVKRRVKRIKTSGLSEAEERVVVKTCEKATGLQYAVERIEADRKLAMIEGQQLGSETLNLVSEALDGSEEPVLVLAGSLEAYKRHYQLFLDRTRETTWNGLVTTKAFEIDYEHRGRRDVSEIAVIDGLVDERLRHKLLSESLGVVRKPTTEYWHKAGLGDTTRKKKKHWGLKKKRLEELKENDNVIELQSRIKRYLERHNNGVTLSLLPPAALGDEVPPIIANAPMRGDTFEYHIDGDPYLFPPSPWRDFFGAYLNREPGKPRLVSALVYLNPTWQANWGAPTKFLDPPTNDTLEVMPRPGRLVLLDQDITHSLTPPLIPDLPRYSLVLKLVLHSCPKSVVNIVPGDVVPLQIGSAAAQIPPRRRRHGKSKNTVVL